MNSITILYVFGIIGVLDTLYLIYHKIRGTDVACPFFPKEWCHRVQHSPQSTTLGVPNSIAGFVMYTAILFLTCFFDKGSVSLWPLQAIVTFGFLFSFYFLYIQAFVLKAFCTWCVLSAINFAVMFGVVWFFL